MSAIRIDAMALYRAAIAHDYKLLAYFLDLRSGEIVSRTLAPEEVQEPPPGPSVKPLPRLGGDLNARKGDALFGPLPAHIGKKPDLFGGDGPKKTEGFQGGFWKREGGGMANPFGADGFKRQSATKKLAELFEEKTAAAKRDPFAPRPAAPAPAEPIAPPPPEVDPQDPLQRIPPAREDQVVEWMAAFAKDSGDPEIRDRLLAALGAKKPVASFERALRKFQRTNQQWERYFYRQALHYAQAWLKDLPIQYEIVEPEAAPGA